MNTLLLLLNRTVEWSPKRWLIARGGKPVATRQVILEDAPDWLSIHRSEDVLKDYESEEAKELSKLLSDPVLYLVEWRGENLLRKLLDAVPASDSAVIDNDHGLIATLDSLRGLPIASWLYVNPGHRFLCPCCSSRTIHNLGGYEICDICKWEDDPFQFSDPNCAGGANRTSLNVARENWKKNQEF
jgi:Cysteine-rich CPCC